MKSTFQFREVHAEARANLRGAQRCQKKLYDVSARVRAFNFGDLVYQRNVVVKLGQCRKLCPLFKGPYLIIRVLSPYLYEVQDRKKTLVLHHDRLKICEERAVPFWVRRKRHQLFQKEGIDEDRAQHLDEDAATMEVEEVVEVQEEDPGETSATVVDEEDRTELVNSDPDVRGPDADLSRSGFPVEAHGRNSDLEESLPYGIEDTEEAQREERLENQAWMDEEEWCIQNLFETGGHSTRSGRKVRTPTYLRDYVQHH